MPSAAVVAACSLIVATAAAQEPAPVERIAAVVNGEVITSTQLEREVSATLAAGEDVTEVCTPPSNANAALEERVLECMIDRLLQFQHVRRYPQFDLPQDALDAAFEGVVDQYPSHEAFEEALRQQHMTVERLRYDLQRDALIANYIDLRFRDLVDVSESEIVTYYDEVLRPEMERQGADLPPLETVDDELIAPLLFEIEVNRRIDEWVAELRRRASIVVYAW